MSDKKMTTGGFFRAAARWAFSGGTEENPVTTVVKASRKAIQDKDERIIDATFEDVTPTPDKKA